MAVTFSTASTLFGAYSSSATSANLASIAAGLGAVETTAAPTVDPIAALVAAEKNHDREVARTAKDPLVKRDVEAFKKAVAGAKTVDEFLKNRNAVSVLLTANGLEDQINYPGLIKKALTSDPADPKSTANRLAASDPAWKAIVDQFNFKKNGLSELKKAASISQITSSYVETRWRQKLDETAPGLSFALTFKESAGSMKSLYNVLGNAVARAVVTEAFGVPAQIAYQQLETQAKAIDKVIDIEKFQNPKYVDAIARRYLIQKNLAAAGGVSA